MIPGLLDLHFKYWKKNRFKIKIYSFELVFI